jgi:hypothetical protein
MALTNLKTVLTKTAKVTSVTLAAPADRIGLGFGPAPAYPTDSLSQGRFPTPRNPEPEQLRSRHGQSAAQMRKQMRAGGLDAVPPASLAGCVSPGSSAYRVLWRLTPSTHWSVSAMDTSRDRFPKVCVRLHDRDCQSPVRSGGKRTLAEGTVPAAIAAK